MQSEVERSSGSELNAVPALPAEFPVGEPLRLGEPSLIFSDYQIVPVNSQFTLPTITERKREKFAQYDAFVPGVDRVPHDPSRTGIRRTESVMELDHREQDTDEPTGSAAIL